MRSSWSSFCLYDNSIGTEKSAAKGWERAPCGGAIENGQHERKDRACKAVSCFAHTQSLGVELVLQHTTVISPNLIARPSRNRSEFAIVSEESQVATTESLVSTRVSRGEFVATGRIHSTLRDRPPFCDGYCSAQKTG